jgi:HAD superfamily hydrolase (TIGR01509 family)
MTPAAILFDLGGVLLPFDPERRVAAIARRLGVGPEAVRALFDCDLPRQMDLGLADEGDFAAAFSAMAGRTVSNAEARELILSVFEAPNHDLWSIADGLRDGRRVGGFSDNPAFVTAMFPKGARLDPMIFSSEIGALKPTEAAFEAVEARLGLAGGAVLFFDDGPANVEAARRRGWDAVRFVSNAQLAAELSARGLL